MLEGEVVLVTDAGEVILQPGDCAGFKTGDGDGHCLQNRSQHDAVILEVGTRNPREGLVHYPGIDLMAVVGVRAIRTPMERHIRSVRAPAKRDRCEPSLFVDAAPALR